MGTRRQTAWAKTAFDRVAGALGLVLLSPVLMAVAAVILADDGWPVLFVQERIGRDFRPFRMIKFRSMRLKTPGTRITAGDDPRVTRSGRFLRRYKIDELPQLWNVVTGEMSLVGPRPEIAEYVVHEDPAWLAVMEVKPGITDLASLIYRDEENMLSGQSNPERYYRESVLPAKLILNVRYMRHASFWLDLKLILLTVRYSFIPAPFDPTQALSKFPQ
ncbi:MAG: sugar transferase [Acidobacteriia bacterium]|nr:sugar transferase [Terriglobia bacterium]